MAATRPLAATLFRRGRRGNLRGFPPPAPRALPPLTLHARRCLRRVRGGVRGHGRGVSPRKSFRFESDGGNGGGCNTRGNLPQPECIGHGCAGGGRHKVPRILLWWSRSRGKGRNKLTRGSEKKQAFLSRPQTRPETQSKRRKVSDGCRDQGIAAPPPFLAVPLVETPRRGWWLAHGTTGSGHRRGFGRDPGERDEIRHNRPYPPGESVDLESSPE